MYKKYHNDLDESAIAKGDKAWRETQLVAVQPLLDLYGVYAPLYY